MKAVIAGVAVILVVGVGAFLYKSAIEKPQEMYTGQTVATTTACSQDARVCPDGTAVGRTGPNCSFAACPPPNVSYTIGSSTLAFVKPSGFAEQGTGSGNIIATFEQTSTTSSNASTITVQAFPIGSGQTPGQVMLANTTFDPSGLQATSTIGFKNITEGSNVYSEVKIGQFEGVVQSAYYLTTPTVVYRFDITERGVQDWMDASLDPDTLPQHAEMLQMLSTVQVSN